MHLWPPVEPTLKSSGYYDLLQPAGSGQAGLDRDALRKLKFSPFSATEQQ